MDDDFEHGSVTPVLAVENLQVAFPASGGRWLPALRGLDLELWAGQTLALVGESGSGKSLTSLALMGLLEPSVRWQAERLDFAGRSLLGANEATWRSLRGPGMAMIFQDPMASLNPLLPVGQQVMEPLLVHKGQARELARQESLQWLAKVGLDPPERIWASYPHQLSGGMRQRAVIAMALICRPKLVIADEPTTALDVTVQAQVLALLAQLQRDLGMALLLITHNLGIVEQMADRVSVCYAGRIVEHGPAQQVLRAPLHPYTQGLLASVPRLEGPLLPLQGIPGSPPPLGQAMPGCPFEPRCALRQDRCRDSLPPVRLEDDSQVLCWLSQ